MQQSFSINISSRAQLMLTEELLPPRQLLVTLCNRILRTAELLCLIRQMVILMQYPAPDQMLQMFQWEKQRSRSGIIVVQLSAREVFFSALMFPSITWCSTDTAGYDIGLRKTDVSLFFWWSTTTFQTEKCSNGKYPFNFIWFETFSTKISFFLIETL